ncbi:MAG TPA: LytTR family DNA-binding domain-containing protein [Puia sp.]|jgi:two-component system LytT family response regulator|nr:LytTR family DNA-binding domain-containing protein [Puia sp.]
MKVLIVEDEQPAFCNLAEELHVLDEKIDVVAGCSTVEETVRWLHENPHPDLILMDVQLSDGLSFSIFKTCKITCPVIFTTAYNKYLTEAFQFSSIDYLLKPISQDRLSNAIRKYKTLQAHFVGAIDQNSHDHPDHHNHDHNNSLPHDHNNSLPDFISRSDRKRSRILVRKGAEFQTVRIEDAGYFFTEHKLIFLVDKENRKYMAEKSNLSELEDELDKNLFYRANRKYIINANYIKRFKPLEKSKISVELTLPVNEEIIISQENSASFKKWIGES